MTEEVQTEPGIQPVDRQRRFRFVAGVVGFCLVTAAMFTGLAAFGVITVTFATIVEMFIGSMVSLASMVALAYLTGSVIDYNGGVANMFTRRTNNPNDYVLPEAKG